jgi:threonine dehydratase
MPAVSNGGIGEKPFEVLKSRLDRVVLISEEEIFEAVRLMLDAHQYLIKPSAALTIAACLTGKVGPLEAPDLIVVSDRNVSLGTLRAILAGSPATG